MPHPLYRYLQAVVALLLALSAASAAAETWTVSPNGQPLGLAQAVARAKDGDTIELRPGDYRGEVAVIAQKQLTLRGVGGRPVLHADGRSAEGKAILVARGGDLRVQNIEFRGARVPDGNGAGIRFERGHLVVERCRFIDNENGILTGNVADAKLDIRDSEFAEAPRKAGPLPHLLYVGRIGRVDIEGSRFHGGHRGHLVKSRARQTRIAYSLLHDGPMGDASYQVDLPEGGEALLLGNVIGKGPARQNHTLVAFGAERSGWPRHALVMAHNTLINEGWQPAWFVRVFRDKLGAVGEVLALNNLVIGWGLFEWGVRGGDFQGNSHALRSTLRGADTGAFELDPGAGPRGRAVDPRTLSREELVPKVEFEWPLGATALAPDRERWSPGAYQR
jgi:hypothetical protein